MSQSSQFDSGSKIAHIHGGQRDGEPPGRDALEGRVLKLEESMTDIRVILGRLDERLSGMSTSLATKADVAEVKGALDGKLGYWQFLGTGSALTGVLLAGLAFILRWPAISAAIGL